MRSVCRERCRGIDSPVCGCMGQGKDQNATCEHLPEIAARQSCAVIEWARRSPIAAKSKALAFKLIIYYK